MVGLMREFARSQQVQRIAKSQTKRWYHRGGIDRIVGRPERSVGVNRCVHVTPQSKHLAWQSALILCWFKVVVSSERDFFNLEKTK